MSIKEREGLTRPLSTSSEGCKAFRVPLNGRKRELYPSYRGRGEENIDNHQTIEPHLKQRPSEEPEVEKPTNNRCQKLHLGKPLEYRSLSRRQLPGFTKTGVLRERLWSDLSS